jgi:NADH dehydrogenase
VVVPLREELGTTDLRLGTVTGLDSALNELRYTSIDGRDEALRYDQLVVALGSVSRVLPVPGLAEHAMGFKTIAEATALRNRTIHNLEIAESLDSEEEREEYLTFIFVGAGYAGVEGLAELQDFVADVINRYPRSCRQGTRWILVEAQDRIMQEIDPGLAEAATRELRARGMEIRTGTLLESVGERSAKLSTGETIPCRLVCWTAGVKPPPIVRELGLPLDEAGRIEVDETMRVRGHENIWAIGDNAAVPDPAKRYKAPAPPTAQHAIRQGKRVAGNVTASLGRGRVRRFRYRTLGVFVDLGQRKAVTQMLFLKLRGFPAWFAARTYHLAMMPGTARKLRLMVDWTVGLLFGRAAAELGSLGHPPSLSADVERDDTVERR